MMRLSWSLFALALVFASPVSADPASPPAAESAAKTPAEQTDELFSRLAKTTDPDEAQGIESAIERLRLRSGSDTCDLLMTRAIQAMSAEQYPLALSVLNTIVDLQPDWAEGWNKRATARYYAGDPNGSMADIAQTLRREPRHLGALAGMGMILEESGDPEDALKTYERALQIAPSYQPMVDAAARARKAVAARSL